MSRRARREPGAPAKQPYTLCFDPALVAEIDKSRRARSRSEHVARLLREALDRRRGERARPRQRKPREPGILTIFFAE